MKVAEWKHRVYRPS